MRLLFRTGDVKIMQELSTQHPRPEPKRTTPLFIAAQHNQLQMVEFLLQQEKEENKRRRKKTMLLHPFLPGMKIDLVNSLKLAQPNLKNHQK